MFYSVLCLKATVDLEIAIIESVDNPIAQMAYLEELIAQDVSIQKMCRPNSDMLIHIQEKCEHLLQRPSLSATKRNNLM